MCVFVCQQVRQSGNAGIGSYQVTHSVCLFITVCKWPDSKLCTPYIMLKNIFRCSLVLIINSKYIGRYEDSNSCGLVLCGFAACSSENELLHPMPCAVMFDMLLLSPLLSSYCCTVITALGRQSRHIDNRRVWVQGGDKQKKRKMWGWGWVF